MLVAYFVPVDVHGFSTRAESTVKRQLWCAACATPCDKSLDCPTDHIRVASHQIMLNECCAVCGKKPRPIYED